MYWKNMKYQICLFDVGVKRNAESKLTADACNLCNVIPSSDMSCLECIDAVG